MTFDDDSYQTGVAWTLVAIAFAGFLVVSTGPAVAQSDNPFEDSPFGDDGGAMDVDFDDVEIPDFDLDGSASGPFALSTFSDGTDISFGFDDSGDGIGDQIPDFGDGPAFNMSDFGDNPFENDALCPSTGDIPFDEIEDPVCEDNFVNPTFNFSEGADSPFNFTTGQIDVGFSFDSGDGGAEFDFDDRANGSGSF